MADTDGNPPNNSEVNNRDGIERALFRDFTISNTLLADWLLNMQATIVALQAKGVDTSRLLNAWQTELAWAERQWSALEPGKPIDYYVKKAEEILEEIDFDQRTTSAIRLSKLAIDRLISATSASRTATGYFSTISRKINDIRNESLAANLPPELAEGWRRSFCNSESLSNMDELIDVYDSLADLKIKEFISEPDVSVAQIRDKMHSIIVHNKFVRHAEKLLLGFIGLVILWDFGIDDVKEIARRVVGDARWFQISVVILIILLAHFIATWLKSKLHAYLVRKARSQAIELIYQVTRVRISEDYRFFRLIDLIRIAHRRLSKAIGGLKNLKEIPDQLWELLVLSRRDGGANGAPIPE